MDNIFHLWYYLRLRLSGLLCSQYCRGLFRLRGISLGNSNIFIGIPFVYKFPESTIRIGNHNEFRTTASSNLIGINRRTTISTHSKEAKIIVGDNCGMSGVVIGAQQSITIGNHAVIGANVLITDFDWHAIDAEARNRGESSKSKPVYIHDNVFIGTAATILKGVTIGQNTVIGAHSVVTSDIPANVIAAGNPCTVVSKLK